MTDQANEMPCAGCDKPIPTGAPHMAVYPVVEPEEPIRGEPMMRFHDLACLDARQHGGSGRVQP